MARAVDLERQLDVALDAPPVEQDRCLEDHPVVAVAAGLRRRLAVDEDLAGGRRGEVADDPQQGGLAAARRPDERDELAGPDRQVDAGQRLDGTSPLPARGEDLGDARDLDDGRGVRAGRSALGAETGVHGHAPIGSTRRSWRSTHDSTATTSR